MYGQLVAVGHGWAAETRPPVVRLGRRRAPATITPAMETASRLALGAAVGAVFGAATSYPGVWLMLGAVVAVAIGHRRDCAAGAG